MLLKRTKYLADDKGQATVEAAVMIPVIFIILLLLIEPGIILYDLCVMNNAASETCRVLATCDEANKQQVCESFAKRRLGAIPQQDNFHLHSSGCSYLIELEGSQDSEVVKVTVKNEVKALPILGFLSGALGMLNSNGCFEIKAESSLQTRPTWVKGSMKDKGPEQWVGKWLES